MGEKRETPEERFKRIATTRTNAVLDKLRILGNLSNRKLYSYSDEDVRRIFLAINKQTREVRAKFETRQEKRFRL
jgi:hypothetical protein